MLNKLTLSAVQIGFVICAGCLVQSAWADTLQLAISTDPTTGTVQQPLVYGVQIGNSYPTSTSLNSVQYVQAIPADVELLSNSATSGTVVSDDTSITWTLGMLPSTIQIDDRQGSYTIRSEEYIFTSETNAEPTPLF